MSKSLIPSHLLNFHPNDFVTNYPERVVDLSLPNRDKETPDGSTAKTNNAAAIGDTDETNQDSSKNMDGGWTKVISRKKKIVSN